MLNKNNLLENYKNIVEEIKNKDLKAISNVELLNRSSTLKLQAVEGTDADSLMVEAFALVKEAIRRTLGLEVYDVQLLAALALHNRNFIEMQTGEGKTLTAVFPGYLNGLYKKGVHILTFNDYLAKRDALWMKPIYEILGLTVGFVQEGMSITEKKEAYDCDITYVTAKEAGFDYLRDSLCYNKEDLIHRPFNFAVVDEADSILIDEARIPLVIAVSTNEVDTDLHKVRDAVITLTPTTDYETDDYSQNVNLTETGIDKIEALLKCGNLYDKKNFDLLKQVNSALYAEVLLQKDIDYIVRKGIIEMVDEFTGRVAENRHWPDGVQGALECKENLQIQSKGLVMTQITLQHFVALYKDLAGMTGTAVDSAQELFEFYDKEVVVIPPNRKNQRIDCSPYVFTHKEAKFNALVQEIKKVHSTGQPILIGTSSIKESSELADQLLKAGVPCQVLNAKNDELEAHIIEKSGVLRAVTVSTNMAGRGIDILLGGPEGSHKEKIVELGGLYVIGTNLHESLRIDKQLMGRAGRQGDPGMTRFFISLEDDLMMKYGINNIIPKTFLPKNQPSPLANGIYYKKLHQVQKIVQGQNSDLRHDLYKYSSIVNEQRQHMYNARMEILHDKFYDEILQKDFPKLYKNLELKYSSAEIRNFAKNLRLFHMDQSFADYLSKVATLKEGIHLTIIAGKHPLTEFHMTLVQEFMILQEEIEEAIRKDYILLDSSKITLEEINERTKPPGSTWTYFVSDDSFEDIIGTLSGIAKIAGLEKKLDVISFAVEAGYYKLFRKS